MGLSQGDEDHLKSSRFRAALLPGMVLAVSALLALCGDWGRAWFRYDRPAIVDGEFWRLLSGHLTHLGWPHFLLNAAGLLLICYLVARQFDTRQWLFVSILIIAGIDAGFWFWQPQLMWYVGLSGLLHGLLAAGTVRGLQNRQNDFWLVAAFLAGKVVYEQWAGPLPGSESTAGGEVVVAAHLYGTVSGALAGVLFWLRKAPRAPL